MLARREVVPLAWGENGFREISNSKRPIRTPDDLKGMKIRFAAGAIFSDIYTAMGANPVQMSFADLQLDEESHEVRRGGKPVSLSPTEFKLLRYLLLNAGRVLSKAQILDHVWQYDFRGDDSIVESYISYLRRKVDTVEPRLIHTLRGVGYVLRLPS